MAVFGFFKKLLFARAIVFSRGAFKIFGIRGVMIPSKTFAMQHYMLLKKDAKAKKVIVDVAKNQGETAVKLARKLQRTSSEMANLMMQTVELMGLGEINLVNPDISTGKAVFKVRNCVVATEYKENKWKAKEPVDYYLRGVIHGAVEELTGKKITCKETKCIARGDQYCEFRTEPVK
jgi:predicted hydrocarbon binding protein